MEPSEPKWSRIVRILLRRFANGKYPPHSKFPSQSDLCREFGVSRITITRVEIELRAAGLIDSRRGITRVRGK